MMSSKEERRRVGSLLVDSCFVYFLVILQKMLQVFEKRISSNNVSHYVQVVYN